MVLAAVDIPCLPARMRFDPPKPLDVSWATSDPRSSTVLPPKRHRCPAAEACIATLAWVFTEYAFALGDLDLPGSIRMYGEAWKLAAGLSPDKPSLQLVTTWHQRNQPVAAPHPHLQTHHHYNPLSLSRPSLPTMLATPA